MKTIILIITLFAATSLLAQVPDTVAQSNGWVKIQPVVVNGFKEVPDTVCYFSYADFSIIRDLTKIIDVPVFGYDKNGNKIKEYMLPFDGTLFFNLVWNVTYPNIKKAKIIEKLNLTEIPY